MQQKDLNISRYYMILNSIYKLDITKHAFKRADERGITADMIEATIKGGKIIRFAKNNFRFVMQYKSFKVICVDEIVGDTIKIVTIERK